MPEKENKNNTDSVGYGTASALEQYSMELRERAFCDDQDE